MPRCAAPVVAMLAVHKSGAAFVQIDPGYPAARVVAILAESRPVVTLTVASVAASVAEAVVATGAELLALDDPSVAERVATRQATDPTDADRVRGLYPQDAAYVLYTSGSTGRPKGVIVEHRNLANLFRSHRSTVFEPHLAGGSHLRARVATTASLSFDGSWIGPPWRCPATSSTCSTTICAASRPRRPRTSTTTGSTSWTRRPPTRRSCARHGRSMPRTEDADRRRRQAELHGLLAAPARGAADLAATTSTRTVTECTAIRKI